ncbi:hypothetical protein [Palleronia sp. LCG004]|uniref:hypothetical protein n=1 Tax=Palleronia sp. LCG004 TaxID=3079304 RepID=UPI0029428786|nr:hypothetical protein [Palleronia sp. LCG004]WOI55610.1 hypothetical protein RVY76_11240 [Palleronia sp. LCG004]
MARLVLVAAIVLALWALIVGAESLWRRIASRTGTFAQRSEPGDALMRKTSFLILVALIFYVSLWGGA